MEYRGLLRDAMTQAGLSMAEVARRAGVSTSTVHRVLNGQGSPSVATLDEIAAACGVQLRVDVAAPCDPDVAAAVRSLVDDTFTGTSPGITAWVERLQRWAPDDPLAWAHEAGHRSGVLRRDDAIYLRIDREGPHPTVGRLASAGDASEGPWALSGAAGLALPEFCAPVPAPTILWCVEPRRVQQLLHGSGLRETSSPRSAHVILVPAPDHLFDGVFTHDNVRYVTPVQIMIDSLSLGGDAAIHATQELATW